jgi:hypothetical protein
MTEATATSTTATSSGLHHVVFVHLTALPAWLGLSRDQRQEVVGQHAAPILAAYPAVSVRWIDLEALTADSSDLLLAETEDLRSWYHMIEALRDTPLFTVPYFRLDRLLVGIEDGYRDYEKAQGS